MSFMAAQVSRLLMPRLDLWVSAEESVRQNKAYHCTQCET